MDQSPAAIIAINDRYDETAVMFFPSCTDARRWLDDQGFERPHLGGQNYLYFDGKHLSEVLSAPESKASNLLFRDGSGARDTVRLVVRTVEYGTPVIA